MNNKTDHPLIEVVEPLLSWYDKNARVLPWRENTDPYRVWVSEIMLQQTRVDTVIPYFDRFIRQLPDIKHLAEAQEDELLKLWEGLGYYSRARNLQRGAQMIMEKHGGRFPTRYEDLLLLPGIGTYTAGAISSIAFGQPVPAVDGNVMRVIARITEDPADIANPATKRNMTDALRQVYPPLRCGDFTQSLMELGALICIPNGVPLCTDCPVAALCLANIHHTQPELPVKAPKRLRRCEKRTVFVLCCGDLVAVQKRPSGGLLGSLWEFPNVEGWLEPPAVETCMAGWELQAKHLAHGMARKHIFTHIEWQMKSYRIQCDGINDQFQWVTKDLLEASIPLPTAFKAFIKEIKGSNGEGV